MRDSVQLAERRDKLVSNKSVIRSGGSLGEGLPLLFWVKIEENN